MTRETSGVYQLPFWRTFGAPVGAILEGCVPPCGV